MAGKCDSFGRSGEVQKRRHHRCRLYKPEMHRTWHTDSFGRSWRMAGKCDSSGRSGEVQKRRHHRCRLCMPEMHRTWHTDSFGRSMEMAEKCDSLRGMQRNRASATAPNPGICCRCGNKTEIRGNIELNGDIHCHKVTTFAYYCF